jgi:hypothetical protein
MSLRGLMAGSAILFVLAGLVYWSERRQTSIESKASGDTSKLVTFKDDEVSRVEILRTGEPPLIAERDKSNNWQITSPQPLRADGDAVSGVVSAFTGLTEDRLVEEKASSLSTFGLAAPAVQVGVTTAGGKKRILSIGDDTPTGGGFFAKLDDSARVFTINSGTKSSLDKSAADLRDKRLLTFDESKLARVEVLAKGQVLEFGKNAAGDWQLVKPRPLRADNLAIEELVRKLREARMELDAPDAAAKFAGASRIATVNTTDASGTQTLEVRKSGEDYFARSTAVEGIYKVAGDLGTSLSKGLDDYRNKKLFEFGFTDPSKVEIRDGEKRYHFVKGGERWWANGKAMDPTSVQSLIDKVRDLTATRFVEAGFTAPVLEIAVTSNEGKRVEKVLVSKASDNYFAKRDGEPSIYALDSERIEELQRAAADVKEPPPPPKK